MDGEINDVVTAPANQATERKELARLIFRAAELRSMGFSWATVGREVERDPETVRKWPKRYAKRWRREYRFAVSANAIAASAEAMQLLRQELRGELPRFRCDSAKAILRYLESRRWRNAKYPKKEPKDLKDQKGDTPESIYRFIQHVESLTDDQREALIFNLGYKKIEPEPSVCASVAYASGSSSQNPYY